MARRSEFHIATEALVEAIEQFCLSGRGRHRMEGPLMRELVRCLALTEEPSPPEALRRPYRRLMKARDQEVNGLTRRAQIPAFVLLAARNKQLSNARVSGQLFGMPSVAEAKLVRSLTAKSGLHLADLALEVPGPMKAQLEADYEELVVQLEAHAVEDLLLAALETFVVPRGRRKFTEVYGLCFGTVRETGGEPPDVAKRVIQVSRVATQIRAYATHDSVTPNDRSAEIHLRVADAVFEHLELVGDYHTHPYRSPAACERVSGWELSGADEEQLRVWVARLKKAARRPRFALVLAVSKAKRSGRRFSRRARNRIQVFIGTYSIQIAAYRLQADGHADPDVELRVPMIGV